MAVSQKLGFDVCGDSTNVCGCPDCIIAEDAFNRANESPIASPWTELTTPGGTDATLTSNRMDFTNANRYKHNTADPRGTANDVEVEVDIILHDVDINGYTEGGVIIGYSNDASYPVATITYQNNGCGYLRIGGRFSGTDIWPITQNYPGSIPLKDLVLGDTYRLRVCLKWNQGSYGYETQDLLRASVTYPNGTVYGTQNVFDFGSSGSQAGLLTTAATHVTFDNFKYQYFRESPDHRTCPNCNTPCLIGEDDFSTDNDCWWVVDTGSYSIGSVTFNIGANGSKIDFQLNHPQLKHAQIIRGRLGSSVEHRGWLGSAYFTWDGTTVRLYDLDDDELDNDADDPASLVADADGMLNFELCQRSTGAVSVKIYDNETPEHEVCASGATTIFETGFWTSLGGDSGAVFDDFEFLKGYDTDEPTDSGCERCQVCPVECEECLNDEAPEFLILTIPTDITDGICNLCDEFIPGTYVLTSTVFSCTWIGSIPGSMCGTSPSSSITVQVAGGVLTVTVFVSGAVGSSTFVWEKTYPSDPECTAWEEEEITFVSESGGGCVSGGAPVLVSAA